MDTTLDSIFVSSFDPADPQSDNCTIGSQWIYQHFKQCVHNPVQYFGFIFGFAAVALWLCAHIMLLGARQREANPSRRELFLILHMCAANICNLVGASLSEQLGTQVFAAAYLIVVDVVFFAHFCYMWYLYRPHPEGRLEFQYSEWQSPERARTGIDDGENTSLGILLLPWLPTLIYLPALFKFEQTAQYGTISKTGRTLLIVGDSPSDNFGYSMGFLAAIAYWAALMPLVLDAKHRKDYLHRRFKVHFFTILANIFYVLSIIMYDQHLVFLLNELPWLISSVGCIILDTVIVYLVAFKENQVIRERKAEERLHRIATIDDEILRHPEDGSQVERTRLDEDALRDRHDSWNDVSETLDGKRLSLILEIDEPEDIIMEQKPRRLPMKRIDEYLPPHPAMGPGVDDMGETSEGFTQDELDDIIDEDGYVFETVGQRPQKGNGKSGDELDMDMEWDFADMSQQYDDPEDESKWHTAKSNGFSWDDDDRIIQEVDAELGDISDGSLEFDDELGGHEIGPNELWYDPNTEVVSN